jgi:aspartate/methionine/tyrosine aminotransferase
MDIAMRHRPDRLKHIARIGVDRMGSIAMDADNSYLPALRGAASASGHPGPSFSQASGVTYSGERNCVISAGGLSGILNVLLTTIEVGDEVIVTDPTYGGESWRAPYSEIQLPHNNLDDQCVRDSGRHRGDRRRVGPGILRYWR